MKLFSIKTIYVADIYAQSQAIKDIKPELCKIHFDYTFLGKGLFIKTKNGYKHISSNRYIPFPSVKTSNKIVISQNSVERLESYDKNFLSSNIKYKNFLTLEESAKLEKIYTNCSKIEKLSEQIK